MKKFFCIFFLSIIFNCEAQINLVPNPSFEIYDTCPDNQGQIYRANNWINFGGSPDYCNSCCPIGFGQSVPNNWGFQDAATGNAYIDLTTFENFYVNSREYAGTQLASSLIIGTKYYLSMRVSPIYETNAINVFTNNIGMLFTTYLFDSSNLVIKNHAHLKSTNIISDTTNWTQISGSFIADSNYQYVIVGNFYSDSNTQIDSVSFTGSSFRGAYYYIDDIIVTTDSLLFSINSLNLFKNSSVKLFPNPSNGIFNLDFPDQVAPIFIDICDLNGKNFFQSSLKSGFNKIDISFLENGSYIVLLHNKNFTTRELLIINH